MTSTADAGGKNVTLQVHFRGLFAALSHLLYGTDSRPYCQIDKLLTGGLLGGLLAKKGRRRAPKIGSRASKRRIDACLANTLTSIQEK